AFDKTGTLTRGAPTLIDIRPAGDLDADSVIRLAAGVEQASSHVLAGAIVDGAQARGIAPPMPENVVETTANGVTATVDGTVVVVGKQVFIEEHLGIEVADPDLTPGELAVHIAADGKYAGYLVLRDELRADAPVTIERLRSQKIGRILMVTGDEQATAAYIADQLHVDEVYAGCLPADKVKAVHDVTKRPVVMVGDGVNDAPVLAAADVGIAMAARGSTAATESADVVILPDEISRVAEVLDIGRHTVNVALQSIWIGIIVSVGLMLVATTGVLPAVAGAWLQEVVDIIAILWALRAMGRRRDKGTT
ncbi:MAG: HAD-IC family P-type ATPase, partial [Propionibacteriaceae bacterium]|nr:HAD-IC family P-type ATPase [Propionibacteriaceae bacterium]